jgi:hypothetical protein
MDVLVVIEPAHSQMSGSSVVLAYFRKPQLIAGVDVTVGFEYG